MHFNLFLVFFLNLVEVLTLCESARGVLQIIGPFADSVMSICLTKTEIIAGSVDGTVRTFDIRMGRYESFKNAII